MEQKALSSSPFTNTYTYEYDVFLSFRGEDTRTGFTGNLYSALSHRGVFTFMDDDGLRKGEEITSSLHNAIRKSRMAIIIFSKNYASSTFCLEELVQILECHTKETGQWVRPIFYDVDPSELRRPKGRYGEALAEHEQGRFKDDIEKVQKWRRALRQAAGLAGWHFQHGEEYEHDFIGKIIEEVSRKLNRPLLHIADYPVGLEARMRNLWSLMGTEFENKVNMLGIHGIGGIGKSTLARAIYNLRADQFEGSCFLANVREKSTRNGLVQIQETVLSELVGERNIKLADVRQGIPILKERLHRKKVLLILDDVDKIEQLKAIAGGFDWFGSGSVVIVTTRDNHLLEIHGVEKRYEVKEFNDTEARELFRWNAFRNGEVDPSYLEIIKRAVSYASGLPLALETIGSNLNRKTLDQWESALEAYKRIPNRDVQGILRVSYDGLEENEKEIFLDIACFFKGFTVRYVKNMLHARGFQANYGISVLKERSLINIWRSDEDDDGIVTMHSLIQYMGRELVRQQSTWPEERNRLWFHEDVICALEKNKENNKIEAMMLDFPEDKEVQWNEDVFGKMQNLRMLIKKKGFSFGSPKHLPNSLRVMEWWGYPAASLPSNFHSKNLVILNLSCSYFQWDKPLQESKVLSQLILTGCEYIRKIPDMSGSPNLTELCIDGCTNLIEIHNSVGFLDKLQRFSAEGCTKLRIVPRDIKLTSLEYLCLRDCGNLIKFPEILGPMEKLKFLDLEGTAIEDLPLTMQNLQGLQSLNLSRCKSLEEKALSNILRVLPNFFPFLRTLRLRDTNLTILPECIEQCPYLELVDVCDCKQLQEINGLPPSTDFLAYNCPLLKVPCSTLYMLQNRVVGSATRKISVVPGQRIPEWFDHTSKGNSLRFWFRNGFPSIAVCAVLGDWDNIEFPFHVNFILYVKINDTEKPFPFDFNYILETDHIFMLNLDSGRPISENGWSCGEVLFAIQPYSGCSGTIKWTGVYVNREFTRMEDVQFTNPCENMIPVPPQQEQSAIQPVMHPSWGQPLDNVYSNLVPEVSTQVQRPIVTIGDMIQQHLLDIGVNLFDASLMGMWISDSSNDRGQSTQAPGFVQSPTPSIGQVRQEPHLGTSSTVLPSTDDAPHRNQTESTQDDVEVVEAFYAPEPTTIASTSRNKGPHSGDKITSVEQINIGLTESKQISRNQSESNAEEEATLHFDKNREDIYENHFSEREDSGQQPVLHDEANINIVESTINEDNMETFYASLEAEITSIHAQDTQPSNVSVRTRPSEETQKALQNLQDFVSEKFSLLLNSERSGKMKDILKYLLGLPPDEGFSLKTKSVILQLSQSFVHWSLDYNNANIKLESATADLSRAEKMKDDLEANVKGFRKMDMVEKSLSCDLSRLQEKKRNLEEQINAIKAEIADFTAQRDVAAKRKTELFQQGRSMKSESDDLRNQVPRLKAEHEGAKITQATIEAEWSKLGEKFIGSTGFEEWN